MPELPEVETVKNGLINKVKGRKIISCSIRWSGIIDYPDIDNFVRNISGQNILDIERKGKFLLFILDDYILLSHLRMEGKYFIKDKNLEYNIHDHVIFLMDNDKELRYNDTRKFGKMYLVKKNELDKTPLSNLGYEIWDKECDKFYLGKKLYKKKAIKTLLLDQSIIAGIGNIYADEILFLSHINPNTNGCDLKEQNIIDIINNTKYVLEESIKLGGSTIHSYSSVDGVTGRFQQRLLVHGKNQCSICGSIIEKIRINGRGTYFCPKCQK